LSTNPSEGVDEEQYAHPPGITPLTTYRSPVIGCLADISTQFCDAGRVGCSGLGWISAMPSSHPGRRRREIDESQRRYAAQPARPLRLWCQSAESSVCLFGLPHLSSLLQRLERQAMIGRGATVPHARATPERLSAFSDGVFAVLITVLVLELRPPELPTFKALLLLWPTWLSYAVSYLSLPLFGLITIISCAVR
jgi:Endosomal/lysosomal potassium channel TMEM175